MMVPFAIAGYVLDKPRIPVASLLVAFILSVLTAFDRAIPRRDVASDAAPGSRPRQPRGGRP